MKKIEEVIKNGDKFKITKYNQLQDLQNGIVIVFLNYNQQQKIQHLTSNFLM